MINICIIATIVIYLVGMLLVGFVYSLSLIHISASLYSRAVYSLPASSTG